jgi:hypothetical protein
LRIVLTGPDTVNVTYVWYAIVLALPTAAGYMIIGAYRGAGMFGEFRHRRAAPAPEPVERTAARLRRLRAELEATENLSGTTAKHHRLQAVRSAYADALAAACARFGVPAPPGGERARRADIYRAEAALREHGVDVREPAVH